LLAESPIGARVDADRLPLTVEGVYPALPRRHALEVPSAQVKSALLLAALNTPGITEVVERVPTRDHSERLFRLFGADIETEGLTIGVRGEAELAPQRLSIPGDPSAAAFLVVAALIVPESELRIDGICVNPRRTGLFRLLKEMGGDLVLTGERELAGEPVADLIVRHSALRGIEVPRELAPDMIDEYPALFVAAAFAEGETRAAGLAELRLKESDRLAAMAAGLQSLGIAVEEAEDGLSVRGRSGDPLPGGATIAAAGDHRVAMSFAVAGLHAAEPIGVDDMNMAIGVDDMNMVATSFPGFTAALEALAAS
jgi:3-phosphoshikimate 1-carboxyvinyltransferase